MITSRDAAHSFLVGGEPNRYVDLGHSRLPYWRIGRGPDVLFVHGWPVHSATFRALVPLLADSFTCHLLDLPGVGRSEWHADTPVGLREHADTLVRFCDAIGLDRFAILAHDSGAVFARLLAAAHPERVRAMVLGGTEIPGHRPWLVSVYAQTARLPFGGRLLRTMMLSRAVRRSFLAFGGCFQDLDVLDGDFHDLFVAPLLASRRAVEGQLRLVRALDWSVVDGLDDVHRRIVAPVQLVWGSEDPFFPIEKARRMTSQFGGGAELAIIDGAKLFAHEDRSEDFARHARRFLTRHLVASAAA